MSDEKPTPFQDVRKGLGLLFRAAKTAVERLPTGGVEEVVATSAREVGRALENVASVIEREVLGKRGGRTPEGSKGSEAIKSEPSSPDEPKPPNAA
ncbi:MAG: hypothetical protein WBY94_03810 [Polyangiaceae bacterium]